MALKAEYGAPIGPGSQIPLKFTTRQENHMQTAVPIVLIVRDPMTGRGSRTLHGSLDALDPAEVAAATRRADVSPRPGFGQKATADQQVWGCCRGWL